MRPGAGAGFVRDVRARGSNGPQVDVHPKALSFFESRLSTRNSARGRARGGRGAGTGGGSEYSGKAESRWNRVSEDNVVAAIRSQIGNLSKKRDYPLPRGSSRFSLTIRFFFAYNEFEEVRCVQRSLGVLGFR